MKMALVVFLLTCSVFCAAQRCDSINASYSGGWKPVATAPRDGTVVEMLETYGIAPWYGRFKWVKGDWISADDPNRGVHEDSCLFWRPLPKIAKGKPYVDPTNGQQNSTEYWCRAARKPYNKKKDACE